ncbi:hypothetical protein ACEQ8H_004843 [Pleosporales sp. CAS-2024a]
MSVMNFDYGRRCTPHSDLSFPNYYCNSRSTPFGLSHSGRADPRGFHLSGVGGVSRGRGGPEGGENTFEHGPNRRRIAVACARCRKRKIRCSGDPGNGSGCMSCRQAGVEASSCQFHRVGSDAVHKVMDNFHIAQSLTGLASSNGLMSLYPTPVEESTYRSGASQTYPTLDTKSMYPSNWTLPYSEDISSIESYGLEQPASYLTTPDMQNHACRWTYPSSRPYPQLNTYFDHDNYSNAANVPRTPNRGQEVMPSEPLSPMNMSSLSLTLPSRQHPRRRHATEGVARQLPIPQPSPAQISRNALDNLQDQRLRSSQGGSAPFLKPLQAWNPNSDALATPANSLSMENSGLVASSTEGALNFLATAAVEGDAGLAGAVASAGMNFGSSSLLDAMTASAPNTKYSNFRETSRKSGSIIRHDSQTDMYSYKAENTSTPSQTSKEDADDHKLINGRRHQQYLLDSRDPIERPLSTVLYHVNFRQQAIQTWLFEDDYPAAQRNPLLPSP